MHQGIATFIPISGNQLADKPGHFEEKKQPVCKKSKWMPDEDHLLQQGIAKFGIGQWKKIAELVPGRSAKQCRERWTGQLDPKLNHNEWTTEEDFFLLKIHQTLGNTWAKIASKMPGRSANAVKNRFRFISKRQNMNSSSSQSSSQTMSSSSSCDSFTSSPIAQNEQSSPEPTKSGHEYEVPFQHFPPLVEDFFSSQFLGDIDIFDTDEWMM